MLNTFFQNKLKEEVKEDALKEKSHVLKNQKKILLIKNYHKSQRSIDTEDTS